jgi:integrase
VGEGRGLDGGRALVAKVKVDGRRYKIYRRPDAHGRVSQESTWYLRAQIHGRMIHRSLDSNVRAQAEVVAARLVRAARAGRWEALEETKVRAQVASLAQVVECYAPLWQVLQKRERTWRANVATLERVLDVAGEARGLSAPVSVLTRRFAAVFQERFMARVKGRDRIAQNAAAVTANSYLRMVRSLFSREVVGRGTYDGLVLPDLKEFMDAPELAELPHQYVAPRPEVLRALAEGAGRLRVENPAVWLVWWLAVQSGLRRGELLALRWGWFREGAIEVPCSAAFVAKGKRARLVPVVAVCEVRAREVAAALGWESGPADLVLQGNADRWFRELGEWMVSLGWDRRQKAHELRKVFASALAEGCGDVYAVKEALGHQAISTTERYVAPTLAKAVDVAARWQQGKGRDEG